MAVKTVIYPPPVVISGNEIPLDISVQNAYVSQGVARRGEIRLPSISHNPGDTIVLTWNGNTATFTCVAAASFTGALGTYPVRSTESALEWCENLVSAFLMNTQLSNDFIIAGVWNFYYTIFFTPYIREPLYNITIAITSLAQHSHINSSFTPNVLYENYHLKLQLFDNGSKFRSPVTLPLVYSGVNASLQYDMKRLLYSDLTGHFTFPESAVRHTHSIFKKIYFQLSLMADNIEAESLPLDHFVYVLPGKVSDTKEKGLNTQQTTIYDDLVSSKRFLSFSPIVKYTDLYSPEKLYFLFTSQQDDVRLRITERYRSDAAQTRNLTTFDAAAYSLHEFSVGFQTIKREDYGTKVLTEYDIWLETIYGVLISERRTFRVDYTYQRHARYFLFKNSFGMYELFRSTGDAEKTNKINKEFYDRVIFKKTDRDQSRKAISISHTYQMQVNTGYMEDPLNFYYAHEFLGSDDVYWLKNDRAYAVQIEPSEPLLSASDLNNLHEFNFLVLLDDMDDTFFEQFLPGAELPVLGDFSDDFSDDFFT